MKPHPLPALVGVLAWNYHRGTHNKSTICSASRTEVGPITFILGWATLTSWFLPHYVRPFLGAEKNGDQ